MQYSKDENLLKAVTDLFKNKMNVNIESTEINNCYRVEEKTPTPDKPPAVLVQFRDVNKRKIVLKQRKLLKNTRVVIR